MIEEQIVARKQDLLNGIENALRGIHCTIKDIDRNISVQFGKDTVVGIAIEDNGYCIYNVSAEWAEITTYYWEKEDDGMIFYYLDSIDECVGEIERIADFEVNLTPKSPQDDIPSLEEQLHKVGLDVPANWRGDIRDKLILLFEPLLQNTDFIIKMNTTDTTSQVLDLFYRGELRRRMGFGKTKDRQFKVFPIKSFYDEIKDKIVYESKDPNKLQPHLRMTTEQLWNALYVITRYTD